jgi:hypothetical protein
MRQTVTPHASRVLSRRDWMDVARQFIAWNAHNPRPSRRERYDSVPRLCKPRRTTRRPIGPNHTVSTRRGTFSDTFQAISCLATFIRSLRDNVHFAPTGQITLSEASNRTPGQTNTFVQWRRLDIFQSVTR